MIKNIIITILAILFTVVLYYYSMLVTSTVNYEKIRMEYIINKEQEIINKQFEINQIIEENKQMVTYKNALDQINIIITNLPPIKTNVNFFDTNFCNNNLINNETPNIKLSNSETLNNNLINVDLVNQNLMSEYISNNYILSESESLLHISKESI